MATWGVKVSDELKEKLTNVMKDSGMEGESFAQQMLTVYMAEVLKQEKPQMAAEVQELQSLTQRIYSIYLNAAERTDNILQSKEETHTAELSRKENRIRELEDKLSIRESEYEVLVEAFNNASEDLREIEKQVNTLADMIESQKSVIAARDEKIDNLTDLVSTYQVHEKEYKELHVRFLELEKELINANSIIKEKEAELNYLNHTSEQDRASYSSELQRILDNHKNEISHLKQNHTTEINNIKDKSLVEKDKALVENNIKHQEQLRAVSENLNNKIGSLQDRFTADTERYQKSLEELNSLRAQLIAKKNK